MNKKRIYIIVSILMMTAIIYTGVHFSLRNHQKNEVKTLETNVPTKDDTASTAGVSARTTIDPTQSSMNENSLSSSTILQTASNATKQSSGQSVLEDNFNYLEAAASSTVSEQDVITLASTFEPESDKEEVLTTLSINDTDSKYANAAVSVADSYVNIRKKASTDSEIIGKLHKDAVAEIIKKKGDWYLLSSGTVEGYAKAEYLTTGFDDETLIKKYGKRTATVNTDGLNVRSKADIDSKKVDVIYSGERYTVLKEKGDWVKIHVEDDNIKGYVKKEFIKVKVTFPEAISIEEERLLKQLEAEQKLAEQQKVAATTNSNTQKKSSTTSKGKNITTVYGTSTNYSNDELMLLACLVHAEAGNQNYEGKLAVANVVLNRVRSGKYPGSISKVIYQKGQFSVAASGSLQKQLNSYSNYKSNSQRLTIKAAKAALQGVNNIGNRLSFNRYSSSLQANRSNSVKIQDHLFW